MRGLVVRLGRQPHEVALLIVCAILGLSGLVAPGRLASPTLREFPLPFLVAWHAGLLVFGLVSLVGLGMSLPAGPLAERVGLIVLASLWLGFGIAVLGRNGPSGFPFATMSVLMSGANLWRSWEITQDLRAMARELRSNDD